MHLAQYSALKIPCLFLALLLLVGCPQNGASSGCNGNNGGNGDPLPAPTAQDDDYSTGTGPLVVSDDVGVLANDTFTAPATVTTNNATTAGGTVALGSQGGFTYTPSAGFEGVDTFVYTLTDLGGSATATARITVTLPGPTGPTARDDGYATSEQILEVSGGAGVLANDTFTAPASLALTGNITALGGFVTLGSNGGFTYIAPVGLSAVDSFGYTLTDSVGSAGANVQITANLPAPPAPTGVNGQPVDGGGGNDRLNGTADNSTINGLGGNDIITGGPGNDLLNGEFEENSGVVDTTGDDVIIGAGGVDRIVGDIALNLLGATINRLGNDLIDGGPGNDNSLLGDGLVNNGTVTRSGDDIVFGGDGNDQIYGDFQLVQITGIVTTCGDDRLFGGNDDDILVGDIGVHNGVVGTMGRDFIQGGRGNDALYGDTITTTGTVTAYGDDTLEGGEGDDVLVGDTESIIPNGVTRGTDTFVFSIAGLFGADQIRDYRSADGDVVRFTGVADADAGGTVNIADLDAMVSLAFENNGGNLSIVVTRRSDAAVLGSITFVNIAFAGQTSFETAGIVVQVAP